MDKLPELASYVIPALTASLAAIFGPIMRTAARLRHNLSNGAKIVESLPEKEKDELRKDSRQL